MPVIWYYIATYGHRSTITNGHQTSRRGRAVLVRRWRDVHDEGHRSSDERLGHASRGPHAARQDDAASPAPHLRGGDLRPRGRDPRPYRWRRTHGRYRRGPA